jgi:hypothetical protein
MGLPPIGFLFLPRTDLSQTCSPGSEITAGSIRKQKSRGMAGGSITEVEAVFGYSLDATTLGGSRGEL